MRDKINWVWRYINERPKVHAVDMYSMQSACGNLIEKIVTPLTVTEIESTKCRICKRCMRETIENNK